MVRIIAPCKVAGLIPRHARPVVEKLPTSIYAKSQGYAEFSSRRPSANLVPKEQQECKLSRGWNPMSMLYFHALLRRSSVASSGADLSAEIGIGCQTTAMKGGKTMATYMALWEVDPSKTPEDPKAKKAQWLSFQEMVLKQLKEGAIKQWGEFAGEMSGYVMIEGTGVDLQTVTARWIPFIRFKAREVLTIEEVNKATRALPE
jgi:hypothetical protein